MLQRVVASAVLLACLTGLSSAQCSEGWSEINGDCFQFFSGVNLNWNHSLYYCEEQNGHLASVSRASTLRGIYGYIFEYSLSGEYWLGGTDEVKEGDWVWLDGSRVLEGTPFWAIDNGIFSWSQEPKGGQEENCLVLDEVRQYYFDDRSCDLHYHPLCME